MLAASAYPALVLNADFRPLSVCPPSTLCWQDALKAVLEDRVVRVASYARSVRSPSRALALPAVIALRTQLDLARPAPLSRLNLFLRDRYRCLYCGERFPPRQLTFDHIQPRSRGGRSTFHNLATACFACNQTKAARTPAEAGMPLLWLPDHPSQSALNRIASRYPPRFIRPEWADYWTVELEP